ncbi:MAG: porin family protein [Alphaproteobacteria bacterium]|nr:porin family protein [Alphaproteobacteria bacterium]
MNRAKISVACLTLLAPSMAQAGTCMDFDKNLRLIEYKCDNTVQHHANDVSIGSDFVDTEIRLLLRVGISPINNQSIKVISDYNPEIWELPDKSKSFSADMGYSVGLGVRIAKPNSWFQDIEMGITQFNGLATYYTQYDKSMTFDATAYTLSYNLGYNVYKRLNAYATAGIAYSEYTASDAIGVFYNGFETSQSSIWPKVGIGLEFMALNWLNLYAEYSYYADIGNDDNFWVAGNFDIQSLSIGLKALF